MIRLKRSEFELSLGNCGHKYLRKNERCEYNQGRFCGKLLGTLKNCFLNDGRGSRNQEKTINSSKQGRAEKTSQLGHENDPTNT